MRTVWSRGAALLAAMVAWVGIAQARSFPSKPITLFAGSAPGSAS